MYDLYSRQEHCKAKLLLTIITSYYCIMIMDLCDTIIIQSIVLCIISRMYPVAYRIMRGWETFGSTCLVALLPPPKILPIFGRNANFVSFFFFADGCQSVLHLLKDSTVL